DPVIRLWDVASGKDTRQLTGHKSNIVALTFSPDGKRLLSRATEEAGVRVWDVDTGKERCRVAAYGFAFTPDGKTLATGGSDRTGRWWDAATGKELRPPAGHSTPVRTVAFSPDGKTVATGSDWLGDLRLWDAATGKELGLLGKTSGSVSC